MQGTKHLEQKTIFSSMPRPSLIWAMWASAAPCWASWAPLDLQGNGLDPCRRYVSSPGQALEHQLC
eukprot:6211216-Pyramimonas_sp.AAC.1